MCRVLSSACLPARIVVAALVGLGTVLLGGASAYAAAPSNDMFAAARAVTGQTGRVAGTLVDSTLQAGEPEHYDYWSGDDPDAQGHSVWYTWTAPVNGEVELSTDNNVVDLYTGSTLSTLQEIGRECDSSDRGWSDNCQYAIVRAGTTYRIALAGYATSSTLSWHLYTRPANDDFANATALTGLTASFGLGRGGDLTTAQTGEPRHWWERQPTHSVWYRWTATWSSRVTVEASTMYSDCEGGSVTDVAVYTGTSLTALRQVASGTDDELSDGCAGQPVAFNAVPGTSYSIAVDSAAYGEASMSGSLSVTPTCKAGVGTAGNDTITGTSGNEVLCGREGDDTIRGMGGDDLIIGGTGVDAASYSTSATPVTASLTTGAATGQGADTLKEVENLVGSPSDDKLDGSAGNNTLNGGPGVDLLFGQAGADTLLGGDGNDTVGGGAGNDAMNGGAGADVAHFGRAPAVVVNLATGSATGDGTDTLALMEDVLGGPGADRITGSTGPNSLQGGNGNDTLVGQDGNDRLYGAGGNDALTGAAGTDACDGGAGVDTAATCETRIAIP